MFSFGTLLAGENVDLWAFNLFAIFGNEVYKSVIRKKSLSHTIRVLAVFLIVNIKRPLRF